MADNKPTKGAASDNPGNKHGEKVKPLVCAEWEALLVDALDGTLPAKDAAAFEAHRATCSACAQLMEEAKRGGEWLHFLEIEPEVPSDLVARILANTSGSAELVPAIPAIAGVPVAIAQPGWLPGLERHAVQSRWIMTAAMAFFSIAFTLNLTGVRITGFHLSDLAPSNLATSLKHQFYVADAGVVHYYNNLRFVYELESRVREMRRDVAPSNSSDQANPAPAPGKNSQPEQKKPNNGSAQKSVPSRPQPSTPPASDIWGDQGSDQAEPALATIQFQPDRPCTSSATSNEEVETSNTKACNRTTYGTKKDRAERSLA